ncbi:discoidin domain-containing protein [Dactylosporangium sp. NPDC051541]|uniref:discoidin domain-containing protein n=1 Tax=Dactylosporangium sp. NPDC051541 TaxID=3363977 RepID=UPI003790A31E
MTSRLRLLWGALVLSAAAAITAAVTVAAVPPAHAADVVLSQNRPVTASSQENGGTPASAAVDGNTGTRWSSAFAATQWFQVDLGSAATVSRIDIAWENAYAKAFSIQFSSDGSAYTQAYSTTTGPGGKQSIAATGTARFVRINLTVRALAAYGYSFWEFQVFGTGSPAATRAINGLTLVNNATRKPILGPGPLVDGTVVDLTRLANRGLSVRADLAAGASPTSVAFTMTGAKGTSYARTETQQPYFLCNDYTDCPLLAAPDAYTLTAQAYTSTGTQLGAAYTVHFTITATATVQSPVDVLFVGNSLIGTATAATGEDTPALVRHLATAAGRTVNVTEVIHFGNTLQQTWDGGEVAAALSGTKQYDFIVLQEYSTLVATNPAQATNTLVNTYAPTFARSLKPGGKVVLFKNWALVDPAPFATRAAETAAIDSGYTAMSAALGQANLIAPISDEFETIIAGKGTSYLIVADGKHPNDTAIYLDAATLYGILLRESPRNLPDLYLANAVAANLRTVAASAIGY